jgi:hypothetical protein
MDTQTIITDITAAVDIAEKIAAAINPAATIGGIALGKLVAVAPGGVSGGGRRCGLHRQHEGTRGQHDRSDAGAMGGARCSDRCRRSEARGQHGSFSALGVTALQQGSMSK